MSGKEGRSGWTPWLLIQVSTLWEGPIAGDGEVTVEMLNQVVTISPMSHLFIWACGGKDR